MALPPRLPLARRLLPIKNLRLSASAPSAPSRPKAQLKPELPRQRALDLGHPWIYDDEVANISALGAFEAGTVVDVLKSDGSLLGLGLLNRQASIVLRRFEGGEVTAEILRRRLRAAFAARKKSFCRAVNGEQDGLPGVVVDRFGDAAVATFEAVGSAKLEFLVQEELARWLGGGLKHFAVHRMSSKKEKWAQDGSEFSTSLLRGAASRMLVEEEGCSFEFDVHHGVAGHWNFALERLHVEVLNALPLKGATVLDAWCKAGQWGVRAAKRGAGESVLLEESLGFAQLCRDNVARNQVDMQCTVLHRGSVLEELKAMATSGIRFDAVCLNVRVRMERYVKQRKGQFGRWFKPSLKNYEAAIYLGAMVTARGGHLAVSFLLPLASEHWALSFVQEGLARAGRTGSLVRHLSALDEEVALASTAMDDAWLPVVVVVRLN